MIKGVLQVSNLFQQSTIGFIQLSNLFQHFTIGFKQLFKLFPHVPLVLSYFYLFRHRTLGFSAVANIFQRVTMVFILLFQSIGYLVYFSISVIVFISFPFFWNNFKRSPLLKNALWGPALNGYHLWINLQPLCSYFSMSFL